jgi:hypothetical protein
MTCNLPASLLNIDMMADGPGKSARNFGATRAFFQKQGGQARQVPPCLKRTLMEQKYSQAAWDAKMEDKVGDFKERGQRVLVLTWSTACVNWRIFDRLLAANYKLSDFSDFWADDYMKKKPGMLRAVEGDTLFRRFRRSGDKGDPSLATLMLSAATAEAPNRGIMEKKAERRSKRSSCT